MVGSGSMPLKSKTVITVVITAKLALTTMIRAA
jgi:hypothetical protein